MNTRRENSNFQQILKIEAHLEKYVDKLGGTVRSMTQGQRL